MAVLYGADAVLILFILILLIIIMKIVQKVQNKNIKTHYGTVVFS